MNTENSKANESKKCIYQFTDKLNLKDPNNKNIGLVNLSIYYTWRNINLHIRRINVKSQIELGMMNSICLMDRILFQTFKTIFSMLLRNMRP